MGKFKGKAGVLRQAGWKTYGVKAAKEHGAFLPELGESFSLFLNLVIGLGLKA